MTLTFSCYEDTGNFLKDSGFQLAAYDDAIEWSQAEAGMPEFLEHSTNCWHRSDRLPDVGEKRVTCVRHFLKERLTNCFWTLYLPPNSSVNGWEEHPEEINQSAFIYCQVVKSIATRESFSWLQVEVIDCISLPDATERIRVVDEIYPIMNRMSVFCNYRIFRQDDWMYISGSGEGDLGNWILLKTVGTQPRMIAFGEWDYHKRRAYLGNISLSAPTFSKLRTLDFARV